LDKNVLVGNNAGKFKVADAEVSVGVAISDESGLYGRRKGGTPQ
jgi:hypothetical protein